MSHSNVNFSLLSVNVFSHISCVLIIGKKTLHRRIPSPSSCFGKLIRNQFIRLMMGTQPKALVLVGFAACGCIVVLFCYLVQRQSKKICCTLTFLHFCTQIELSLLKKQPIICTRTLQSPWLFQQLRDTMVCNGY